MNAFTLANNKCGVKPSGHGACSALPAAERLLTIAVLAVGIAQIIVSRPRPGRRPDGTS